ncbi:chromate transporter [Chitinophaga dinghuensis]|uniref:Chromate transporter n=1 Tax=Chitinophaga dinghuensis TaxID=1539050 RepID=A0A327VNY2_9BACT|nr:chromate efflux transporter [Chitinophaga dinghuensis]RAJ75117.1 chromate transporter [Chitinophaga dinghuensis]
MDVTAEQCKVNKPSFKEALRFWFILGWISFGGTTGHVTIMHDFLVDKKKWISSRKFFHALNACMVLPGPEAHQLAIYIGWKLHGIKGGIVSGLLFVLPSMMIILGLSIVYALFGNTPLLVSVFNGLKPAVLAIILFATWKVGQKALTSYLHYTIAIAAFALSYFGKISMPWIILGVIITAILVNAFIPGLLHLKKQEEETSEAEDAYYVNVNQEIPPISKRALLKQGAVFLLLWLIPFLGMIVFLLDGTFWKKLSLLFTQSAFLTVGGSYTVIPYVAELVTRHLSWLSKTQMIDGFALAETTPGPLVIVLTYVGFMSAYNHFAGSLIMGTIGLLAAGYFTFLPNFLLIFMGASLIERSQKNRVIKAVLSLVTAAVVGVIVNLAFYLGGDILFRHQGVAFANIDWIALGWVGMALMMLTKFRWNMLLVVLISLLFGLVRYFLL